MSLLHGGPFCDARTDRFDCTLQIDEHGPYHVAQGLGESIAAVWRVGGQVVHYATRNPDARVTRETRADIRAAS